MSRWLFYFLSYLGQPPWNAGISPPELLEFIQKHPPGRALDMGCGTGTHAITLAQHGWSVTGIDYMPGAIWQARRKAKQAGLKIDFRVHDVTHLEKLAGIFNLILDIGCYHNLAQQARQAYQANILRFLSPGGAYLLYGFLNPAPDNANLGIGDMDIYEFTARLNLESRIDSHDRGDPLPGFSSINQVKTVSKSNLQNLPERHILFLFLDGIGLGVNDRDRNPFARAELPALEELLGGRRLLLESLPGNPSRLETDRATLLALDAGLGIEGVPQSATGQAALLTGRNVPAELGYHYGPKPNPDAAAILRNSNIFSLLFEKGFHCALLNAYPPRYFHTIESGRRLYSAIPLAVTSAGIPLRTQDDLQKGKALSADFTAEGWRTQLGFPEIPVLEPAQAGMALSRLSQELNFAMFEYWLSDYAGHKQNMGQACHLLETFDRVLEGLLKSWDDKSGLILITSDHGNLEDLSTRHHTLNRVPALVIGTPEHRRSFTDGLSDLTGISPAILRFMRFPRLADS